jgi:hypothetical protein
MIPLVLHLLLLLLLSLQNCFVKLDTSSQEDMLRVVTQLHSSTLAGHPVHTRVKSSTAAVVDGLPWTSQAGGRSFEPFDVSAAAVAAALLPKKKTRSRGRRKKKPASATVDGTEVKVTPVESVAEHSVVLLQATLSWAKTTFPPCLIITWNGRRRSKNKKMSMTSRKKRAHPSRHLLPLPLPPLHLHSISREGDYDTPLHHGRRL